MVRSKEYIREDVLDAATEVFWAKGFKGTSVSDLVSATGLNKHSMYAEFGSKEGLFRECIDNFAFKFNKEPIRLLSREPLGMANIEAFFTNRVDFATSCHCPGCFLVNTTVERDLIDGGAFQLAKEYLGGSEQLFQKNLQAATQRGEISIKNDCAKLAAYLLTVITGIMVLAKTEPDKEALTATVKVALSTIKR